MVFLLFLKRYRLIKNYFDFGWFFFFLRLYNCIYYVGIRLIFEMLFFVCILDLLWLVDVVFLRLFLEIIFLF